MGVLFLADLSFSMGGSRNSVSGGGPSPWDDPENSVSGGPDNGFLVIKIFHRGPHAPLSLSNWTQGVCTSIS